MEFGGFFFLGKWRNGGLFACVCRLKGFEEFDWYVVDFIFEWSY